MPLQDVSKMCTDLEGWELYQKFKEYRGGKEVAEEDEHVVERLVNAAYLDYVYKCGRTFAKVSEIYEGAKGRRAAVLRS